MTLVYLILPVTFLIAAGFVLAFVRAARSGQFDDLTTPAIRAALRDADPVTTQITTPMQGTRVEGSHGSANVSRAAGSTAARKGPDHVLHQT